MTALLGSRPGLAAGERGLRALAPLGSPAGGPEPMAALAVPTPSSATSARVAAALRAAEAPARAEIRVNQTSLAGGLVETIRRNWDPKFVGAKVTEYLDCYAQACRAATWQNNTLPLWGEGDATAWPLPLATGPKAAGFAAALATTARHAPDALRNAFTRTSSGDILARLQVRVDEQRWEVVGFPMPSPLPVDAQGVVPGLGAVGYNGYDGDQGSQVLRGYACAQKIWSQFATVSFQWPFNFVTSLDVLSALHPQVMVRRPLTLDDRAGLGVVIVPEVAVTAAPAPAVRGGAWPRLVGWDAPRPGGPRQYAVLAEQRPEPGSTGEVRWQLYDPAFGLPGQAPSPLGATTGTGWFSLADLVARQAILVAAA